ncbi:MAG: DEAD/DEAH box helicase [Anaerolineae bacterium]|nr:DEAD/DEAH box helicase [Anaerolineae bacterium]
MTNNTSEQTPDDSLVEPESTLPPVALADLPEPLQKAAARAGWTQLMPVQARAIPYFLAGRDLLVQSRTGSGKTAAFLLPILDRIDVKRATTQALVLAPTRELAHQVGEEAQLLAGGPEYLSGGPEYPSGGGLRTAVVYGGVSYKPQIDAFRRGAHLVVGTPGRILDHLLKHNLSLSDLQLLIFDEADRMLSMGFYPDMRAIREHLPRRRVQGGMFSATFPAHVMRLAGEFLSQPEFLSLSRDHVHVTDVDHVFYVVPRMDKDRSLVRIIEVENPPSALIFCNTRQRVHYVTAVLQRFGYDADEISSDLSQQAREKIMQRTRQGKLRFLVATDVAARGIDLPDLSHVILYEPPDDMEIYIHRAGRTGRAGGSGVAISLVDVLEQMALERIAKRYKIEMEEWPLPTDEDVAAVVSERVTALLESRLRGRDKLQIERMERFEPLIQELVESEEGRALLTMLLDDDYQETLHAPPPQPGQEPEPKPQQKGGSKRRRSGRRR